MGAIVAAAETAPPTDSRYPLQFIQFVQGFQHALQVAAAIALMDAVVSAVLVRHADIRP
jgi:hypothetical protein